MWNGFSRINIYNNHIIKKKLMLNIYILGKFQCTSLIKFSFDDFFLKF